MTLTTTIKNSSGTSTMIRLYSILLSVILLTVIACEKSDDGRISMKSALALAVEEVFFEDFSTDEPLRIALEIVETPESWDFLFEWEPGAPGMHATIIVSKKDGTVDSLEGL